MERLYPKAAAPRMAAAVLAVLACAALAFPGQLRAQDYVVQVSSLATQEAAQTEAARLLRQGVPSFQRTEDLPGRGPAHRVYLGPFSSRGEAQAAADALKSSGVVKDFIVRQDTYAAGTAAAGGPVAPAPAAVPQPGAPGAIPAPPVAGGEPVYEPPEPPFDPSVPVLAAPAPPQPQTPQAQVPGGAYGPAPAMGPGGESWSPPPQAGAPAPAADGWGAPAAQTPAADGWGTPPAASGQAGGALPRTVAPGETVYWTEPTGSGTGAAQPPAAQADPDGWGPPPAYAPSAPQVPAPAAEPWPPVAQAPAPAAPPASAPPAPVVAAAPAPAPVAAPSASAPRRPGQPDAWQGKANAFTALVDLSSSMLWLSPCRGGLVKAEAESTLLRKMSQRLPSRPYVAALRVFGYQQAWKEADFTTLYYGPTAYERSGFDQAVARLAPASAISPFSVGLKATATELEAMPSPRVVLMLSDFEVTSDPGDPPQEAGRLRGRFGGDTRVYAFHVTKVKKAKTLAANVGASGGGKSFDVCAMLEDDSAFEAMMDEIFGPKEEPPCADSDGDGVCDFQDVCPNTPEGAPVDSRGCWIAAYSQFFDFDKAVVKSAFVPRLQYAAEIIKKNPQLGEIIIAGHTDNKGTDAYNLDLGRRRAQAVMDILVKNGAPAERLKVESFGKTRPVAENNTEEGRAQNRRVEFHVGQVPPASATIVP